jgi:RNA polymerase sigma-70 factor (ECF subfamily)
MEIQKSAREHSGSREHCLFVDTETSQRPKARRPDGWRALADLPDERLVELVRGHDLDAFEALMRRHNRRLFRVARSVLRDASAAEDAVQEAYLRAFTHLDQWRPTGKFSGWLTRIALNEALMMRRRERGDTVSLDAMNQDESMGQAGDLALRTADDYVEAVHARALLERAVDGLPEHFRTVFMLRMVEGLDVNETAECLELNATTVRTRLHRAQNLLRAGITKRLEAENGGIFGFAGARCDRIVAAVLARLG